MTVTGASSVHGPGAGEKFRTLARFAAEIDLARIPPEIVARAKACAALAWTCGTATLAGLNAFAAQEVLAVAPKVVADPERARYQPKIIARLADGPALEWEDARTPTPFLGRQPLG